MTTIADRERQELIAAFEEDHRRMTRGIERLRELVAAGGVREAVASAQRLDVDAGGHIEFEEEVFYPFLRARLGDEAVDRFYREHAAGQRAVEQIRRLDPRAELTAERRAELQRDLQTARDHALSCGTLVSHLENLGAPDLAAMRAELERARRTGRRWTSASAAGAE
ncbi:MAG TPA: hemerythrin domain-containing protein [Thermoanaerobaculia bacterium]|nr:hemerythrin domain-containing protein [Thermoanaerobaculia bacterium]